jgi:ABC-type glycerol-3-phosphate transport system substrate-binding protein
MDSGNATRMNRRRLMGHAGAGAAGLALAGRLASPTHSSAQETVTLTWLTDLPNSQEHADAYTALNPSVKIEVELVTFREVFQQNQVRLGSKSDNPDIVSVDAPVNAAYGLRGWLMPLDDAIPDDVVASWVDAQNESSRYNGQLLSAPIWNSGQLLFYNADLLAAAGITPPAETERWTWDQLSEAAKAVTSGDVFGFQFEQYNRIYQLQPLPQGKGVPVIGEDGLTVKGVIDAPEWVEAFTWFSQIHNEWKVAPQGTIDVQELFNNQKLAMCIRGPWAIKSFTDANLPFAWRAAPHPYWGGEIHVPTDSWHLGVNPNSKHTAEAAAFVAWSSSIDGGRSWRELSDIWPAQKVLLDEIFNDPANADWPGKANQVAATEAEHATPRPLTPGYLEYEEILSDSFEDIRNGADVQESLTGAADQIDREMEKYR